ADLRVEETGVKPLSRQRGEAPITYREELRACIGTTCADVLSRHPPAGLLLPLQHDDLKPCGLKLPGGQQPCDACPHDDDVHPHGLPFDCHAACHFSSIRGPPPRRRATGSRRRCSGRRRASAASPAACRVTQAACRCTPTWYGDCRPS